MLFGLDIAQSREALRTVDGNYYGATAEEARSQSTSAAPRTTLSTKQFKHQLAASP